MHFSKSYAQTLLSLPPELRESAINYRRLKKSLNQVVQELASLGFNPEVVRDLVKQGNDVLNAMREEPSSDKQTTITIQPHALTSSGLRLLYEVDNDLGRFVPHLRLIVNKGADMDAAPYVPTLASFEDSPTDFLVREYIIPLASDAAFFDLLTNAVDTLSTQLSTVRSEFMVGLTDLSKSISASALPISQTDASYRPFSVNDDPGAIDIPSTKSVFRPGLDARSDLYLWRRLLDLYVDAEVFDSIAESTRGERSLEDTEARMAQFLGRVEQSDILRGKSKKSHLEVEAFLKLNTIILNLKKLNYASTEAARKILKKHVKRTALPFPPSLPLEIVSAVGTVDVEVPTGPPSRGQMSRGLILLSRHPWSLPQLLVQAIGETILPIVPRVEDYSCAICTSIAFKPIRLSCGHLFCVRCLVKMQKQSKSDCPMCRSPCVLAADRSNVDWASMNFMADWFPVESREKLLSNEREVSAELARQVGFDRDGCFIV